MTATCQLCGQVISAPQMDVLILNPSTDPASSQAMAEIAAFDRLAGHMSTHIVLRHKDQAAELAAVAFLAGKVYAMTFAASTETENFQRLRESWKRGVLIGIEQSYDPTAAPGEDSTPPEGSNVKNASRNFSN